MQCVGGNKHASMPLPALPHISPSTVHSALVVHAVAELYGFVAHAASGEPVGRPGGGHRI